MGYNLWSMLEELKDILQDKCHLNQDRPLILGVSGGPDSLCVLDVLDRFDYPLIVVHFNHKLRPNADKDAEIIRQMVGKRKRQFLLGEADVYERAAREKESIEEAARNERYHFLFQCAEKFNAQAVMVGHTADDQVETVLMHLIRGSGLSGLGGMRFRSLPNAWSDKIPLVRPLLEVWRNEVIAYCSAHGLEAILDESNLDMTFFRNRLRHEMIPYLESYNPEFRKVFVRTVEILQAEEDFIQGSVTKAWADCILESGLGYVGFDSGIFYGYPLNIQRHLVRRGISVLRPDMRDIGFNAVELALQSLSASKSFAEVDLISGLKMTVEPGRFWIAEWQTDIPTREWPQVKEIETRLVVGEPLILQAGWQLSVRSLPKVDLLPREPWPEDETRVWIDQDQVELPLIVRARTPGDRIQPFGMGGRSVKISDYMINEKLPHRARQGWPLVCSGKDIVWVCGYRLAHPFRVKKSTTEVLELRLSQVLEVAP